jgi:bifunctional DNA-binding transcriptional regulator/antitoxin component of YhaV-PrlF toxin-antitoxin module
VVTIRAAVEGKADVTSQGYLRLPAAVRYLCGLEPGDRVLLVADPQTRMVRVYPPATLDRLLAVEDIAPAGDATMSASGRSHASMSQIQHALQLVCLPRRGCLSHAGSAARL